MNDATKHSGPVGVLVREVTKTMEAAALAAWNAAWDDPNYPWDQSLEPFRCVAMRAAIAAAIANIRSAS